MKLYSCSLGLGTGIFWVRMIIFEGSKRLKTLVVCYGIVLIGWTTVPSTVPLVCEVIKTSILFHSILFYCSYTTWLDSLPQEFTLLIWCLIVGSVFERPCIGPLHWYLMMLGRLYVVVQKNGKKEQDAERQLKEYLHLDNSPRCCIIQHVWNYLWNKDYSRPFSTT